LNGCNNLTDWTIVSGTPTLEIDAVDTADGDGALKITADEQCYIKLPVTAFNLHKKSFTCSIKCDDLSKLISVSVYLYSSAGNYFYKAGVAANPGVFVNDIIWSGVVLHPGELTVGAGAPDLSAINEIRIMVNPVGGQTPIVRIDDIGYIDNLYPGVVVWTFDDGFDNHFTVAFPMLKNAGMTGVMCVPTATIGGGGAMTAAQIKTISDAGFDIIPHGHVHSALTSQTVEQRRYTLLRSKAEMAAIGIGKGNRFFATPGGAYNSAVIADIAQIFDHHLTGLQAIDAPSPNLIGMARKPLEGTPIATAKAWMDSVRQHGGVLGLYLHSLNDVAYLVADFQELLDYQVSLGLRAATCSDLVDLQWALPRRTSGRADKNYLRPAIVPARKRQIQTTNWTALSRIGSAVETAAPLWQRVRTGVTANSSGGMSTEMIGFGGASGKMDWDRNFYLEVTLCRKTANTEAVARLQIKNGVAVAALAEAGVGLEINNYALVGESYGTSRDTVALGNLSDDVQARIGVHFRAAKSVDFYVNDILTGSISTAGKIPTGAATATNIIHTHANGATGGADAYNYLMLIEMEQE
jgi:peptidoglycan/xylan/chitin deacetylase (PgdA/CDA1 family)